MTKGGKGANRGKKRRAKNKKSWNEKTQGARRAWHAARARRKGNR